MKWDGKLTEAMVETRLWRELVESGLEAETQIVLRLSSGKKLRADVAILDGDEIIGLVEVKTQTPTRGDRTRGRQFSKYQSVGLPWRYCDGIPDIIDTVQWARDLYAA